MASVDHIFTDILIIDDFDIREEAQRDLHENILRTSVVLSNALSSFQPDQIDCYQEKVINEKETPLRVVAPAGSGKTQTVINRVLFNVKNGLNPKRILVLTFDNSAASSLKNYLNNIQEKIHTPIKDLQIVTLNSFGYRILREYFKAEFKNVISDYRSKRGFKEVHKVLQEKNKQIADALPKNLGQGFFLDYFGLLKNELFDPRNFNVQLFADFILKCPQRVTIFSNSGHDSNQIKKVIQGIAWLFQAYEKYLQRENLLDFDDQKLRAYLCLEKNLDILKVIQNSYSEIIVDEFQDINKLDFELIKQLSLSCSLVVTGDDDQAIYGFRGCSPEYIINFAKHLDRNVTSHELQINYRCPANIVDHADRLICHNKWRISKAPIAHKKEKAHIKVVSTLTSMLEAKSIVSLIKKIKKGNDKLSYKDFAVLYRTNAQSLPLQIEFILNDLPYFVRDVDNILSNEQLDKLLGVLKLKVALDYKKEPHHEDAVATVKSYFQYLNTSNLRQLETLFKKESNFLVAIASDGFYAALPKAEKSNFNNAINELLKAKSLMDCLDVLSKRFRGLYGMIGSLEDVIQERVPLGEIYDIAANFRGKILDFIQMMERAINNAKKTSAGKNKEAGIALLTYFKSKGLQWQTVILTTCNEGLIPHARAPIEDERRLFYVAMTRTSSNLIISYVKSSCNKKVPPSRFLYESGLITK